MERGKRGKEEGKRDGRKEEEETAIRVGGRESEGRAEGGNIKKEEMEGEKRREVERE